MGPRRRPPTAAVLGGCVLLVAAGCAPDAAEASLDPATGAVLADSADRLAEALEADDACRALQEAEALRERAARALEAGDAPEDVVAETTRVVAATTGSLTCEVDAATEPDEDADETDEPDGTDETDGTAGTDESDAGGGTSQDAGPAPAPPPEDDADEPQPDGGGPSGPARGQGPDGDGPPGHRDDRGGG